MMMKIIAESTGYATSYTVIQGWITSVGLSERLDLKRHYGMSGEDALVQDDETPRAHKTAKAMMVDRVMISIICRDLTY